MLDLAPANAQATGNGKDNSGACATDVGGPSPILLGVIGGNHFRAFAHIGHGHVAMGAAIQGEGWVLFHVDLSN